MNEGPQRHHHRRRVLLSAAISVVLLLGVIAFTWFHFADARRLADLARRANPAWMVLALGLQLASYICAGAIWQRVVSAAGFRLRVLQLARLAVEKLSVDQLMPSGGFAGNVVVVRALQRLGIPPSVATEALLIDILSYYAAYSLVVLSAFGVLKLHHGVTHWLVMLLIVFGLLLAGIPLGIIWLLNHRDWRPGPRLSRIRSVHRLQETLAGVSPTRVRDPRLLSVATSLNLAVFLLDAATLWAVLMAVGARPGIFTAFAGLAIGSLSGTLSLLPGGIGGFEAGCTATLALLGVPVEAALTGTLLLRGLTLWIPLIPGVLLARRDLSAQSSKPAPT